MGSIQFQLIHRSAFQQEEDLQHITWWNLNDLHLLSFCLLLVPLVLLNDLLFE